MSSNKVLWLCPFQLISLHFIFQRFERNIIDAYNFTKSDQCLTNSDLISILYETVAIFSAMLAIHGIAFKRLRYLVPYYAIIIYEYYIVMCSVLINDPEAFFSNFLATFTPMLGFSICPMLVVFDRLDEKKIQKARLNRYTKYRKCNSIQLNKIEKEKLINKSKWENSNRKIKTPQQNQTKMLKMILKQLKQYKKN